MLSNIVVQKILYLEVKRLFNLYRREIRKYLNYNFLNYLKNVVYPKDRHKYYRIIRIIFLFFIVRFIIDIIRFFFNFYYIFFNWFFNLLKFSIKFYTDNQLAILFFSKLIDFIKYFFLFMPLVRLSETLNKKKMTLLVYIFVRIMQRLIRIIRWRPRFRKKLVYPVRSIKMLVIWFGWMPTSALMDFLILLTYVPEFIHLLFIDWILFLKIIYYVWQYNRLAGVSYLRKGSSLFHIAVLMQNRGFRAPKVTGYEKFRARLDYLGYCQRYKKSELPPDYLNDEALDIYIFLLDLFSNTRYELRFLPIKEFFFLIFPYDILVKLFIFSYYLYVGTVFLLYCLLVPLVIICLLICVFFDYVEYWRVLYFLFFRDLEYLAKEKDKIWKNIREKALKLELEKKIKEKALKLEREKNINDKENIFSSIRNKLKKIYDKIIR